MLPPGSVNAPAWLLPTAAAGTSLLPLLLLAAARPAERVQSPLLAPDVQDGWAITNADRLAVGPAGGNKGNGLFALDFIPKNTYIMDYEGEHLTKAEYDHRYPGVRLSRDNPSLTLAPVPSAQLRLQIKSLTMLSELRCRMGR